MQARAIPPSWLPGSSSMLPPQPPAPLSPGCGFRVARDILGTQEIFELIEGGVQNSKASFPRRKIPIILWLGRGPGAGPADLWRNPPPQRRPSLAPGRSPWRRQRVACAPPPPPGPRPLAREGSRLAELAPKPAGQGPHGHALRSVRSLEKDVLIPFHPLSTAVSCLEARGRQVSEIGTFVRPHPPPTAGPLPRRPVRFQPARCPDPFVGGQPESKGIRGLAAPLPAGPPFPPILGSQQAGAGMPQTTQTRPLQRGGGLKDDEEEGALLDSSAGVCVCVGGVS